MTEKGMFDLSGKVALVTGGGQGLGREICEAMAEFGADVVCCYATSKEGAEEVVDYAKKLGRRAIAIQADVSNSESVANLVSQTVAELGTIDILFNNAAIMGMPMRLHEVPVEAWDGVMAVNLRGVFVCMKAVLPLMVEKKSGSIINISSISGLMAGHEEWSLPDVAPYAASKAGVNMLTRHAASAYAKDGIRINTIAPGAHRTKLEEFPPELLAAMEAKISKYTPLGRPGEPREIKGLAVYLASDASSYVTGQIIVQDGGFTV